MFRLGTETWKRAIRYADMNPSVIKFFYLSCIKVFVYKLHKSFAGAFPTRLLLISIKIYLGLECILHPIQSWVEKRTGLKSCFRCITYRRCENALFAVSIFHGTTAPCNKIPSTLWNLISFLWINDEMSNDFAEKKVNGVQTVFLFSPGQPALFSRLAELNFAWNKWVCK